MTVDIIVSLTLGIFLFLGWRSGLIRQIVRIGAAIAVFFLSPTVANLIRTSVWTQNSPAKPLIEASSLLISGILIYATIAFSGWLALKAIQLSSDALSNADRAGGAALSFVKGLLISYVVVSVAIIATVPLKKMDPDDRLHVQNSYVLKAVEAYNVILPWQFPEVNTIHGLIRVARAVQDKPELAERFRDDTSVADVLRREEVKAIGADDGLVYAANNANYPMNIANETVRKLLSDDEFVIALNKVEWAFLADEIAPLKPTEPADDSEQKSAPADAEKEAPEPSEAEKDTAPTKPTPTEKNKDSN